MLKRIKIIVNLFYYNQKIKDLNQNEYYMYDFITEPIHLPIKFPENIEKK
jgi:hypothetical protein